MKRPRLERPERLPEFDDGRPRLSPEQDALARALAHLIVVDVTRHPGVKSEKPCALPSTPVDRPKNIKRHR